MNTYFSTRNKLKNRSHRSLLTVLALTGALASGVQTSQASGVVLNDGGTTKLEVTARDTSVSFVGAIVNTFPAALPFSTTLSAAQGTAHSEAHFDLSESGFTVTSFGSRPGRLDSGANVQPTIFFSVSSDTLYDIAGSISTIDPSGKYVALTATLTDVDTATTLYHSNQEGFGTPSQSFVLGGLDGNWASDLSGSSSGLLLAGHRYKVFFGSSIYAANSGDPASFTGSFSMTLREANSVPDTGSTLACSVIGLGILGLLRQRIIG